MSKKILIVDDEQEVVLLLEKRLAAEGYETVKASNGRDGVKQARTESPDLILMDIDMPVLDGADALRELKADGKTKEIPVVFMTGMIKPNEEKFVQNGITVDGIQYDALAKPFDMDRLLTKVKSETWDRMN